VRFQVHTAVFLEIQVIWYINQVENMAYGFS